MENIFKKKLKILLVHNFSQVFNGEDAYVMDQAKLLRRYGHNVILFTKNSKDIISGFITDLKISKGMFINETIAEELRELIIKTKPEIVHIHNIYPLITPIVYKVCKLLNVPVIQHIHNYRFFCSKSILFRDGKICELCIGKMFKYPSILCGCYHSSRLGSFVFSSSFFIHKLNKIFDSIDTYIFPSSFTKDYYLKNTDKIKDKAVIIPYFVDQDNKVNDLKISGDYFLFVGRLSEEKGIMQLLELFVLLPTIKLIVIGDGPLKDKVDAYSKFKNICIKNFLPRREIFKYMKAALFTIIPSLWFEVLPMVMLESWTNGTPVIVPGFSSFIEAVEDRKTGLFYKQYDFEDLKRKIIYAYENKAEMIRMGINARKVYEKKYTPEKHYQALMRVYKNAISG